MDNAAELLDKADDASLLVDVHRLSDETRRAWGFEEDFMSITEAAWAFFCLREMGDTAGRFPKGKWASIQHFEGLIQEQAQAAMHEETNGDTENAG
jgi:hypothetical protein